MARSNYSAASAGDIPSTPYEDALASILDSIPAPRESERIPILQSLDRVAAENITAAENVPGHRNSAMDGYACRFSDLAPANCMSLLKLVGISAAGNPFSGAVHKAECVRIFTGGVIPDSLDTVIMQEDCTISGDQISTINTHKPGQHVRQAGEDISAGEVAVTAGQSIGTAELGLLASVGRQDITSWKTPKVAFFSTGDELKGVGEPLDPGDIHDSNRYTLYSMLRDAHCEPIDLGVVRDNLGDTIDAINKASKCADVIVTTAGASVGDADFVKQALETLGELTLWKVAMRPGRPLAFGKVGSAWFFGLPGNPVSVVVTFDKFVWPALRKLRGENPVKRLRINATTLKPIFKTPGRLEFQRGIFSFDANGNAVVESTGNQSSGVLTSMSRANCYIVLPSETGNLETGTALEIEPFKTFL